VALGLAGLALAIGAAPRTAAASAADVEATVSRSDIFVGQPNIRSLQAMPLGNGRLGVAVWAADGLTLQLNRIDTLPGRLSPGQVVIQGLKPMIADPHFRGRLDLFNGEWRQSGAGVSVHVVVDPQLDRVVVDVTGADPTTEQTVLLKLWQPRSPTPVVTGTEVGLSEHWTDDTQPGASGLSFGSLAGVRVVARDTAGRKIDDRTVATTFHAMPDGHYRIVIASPSFNGHQDPTSLLRATLDPAVDVDAAHRWWHDYWSRVALIEASSRDGRAEYFETMRTLFLFYSAAQSRGTLPGSQAGIGDLFSSAQDIHFWDPASFWEWNLRMQVAANLSAGVPELNEPYFALYRNNLDAIRRWTRAKMGGRDGICVPETMRFNGVGVEYESPGLRPFPIITHSCDQEWTPVANARTLSTGGEVGLWVWETYLKTGDTQFLRTNYPLMAEAARFLLAYQKPGADGLLHTSPSNAHETQADVRDPTTDLAAIRALYPATIAAARLLSRDRDLAAKLTAALAKTPELPLMDAPPAAAAATPPLAAADHPKVIAPSYNPTSPLLNAENIGLEPVWPYSLISPESPLFETAVRTYEHRPFRDVATWSYDAVQAARLGLGAEMVSRLNSITQLYQLYPNGMAEMMGNSGEFYIEQIGVVAVALSEALVQDHGDVIRIAPAIPPDWTVNGTVYVRGNARITVTAIDGKLTAFTLAAASKRTFRIANPWHAGEILTINADPGRSYIFPASAGHPNPGGRETTAAGAPTNMPNFTPGPPTSPKSLGRAAIGIAETCCTPPKGYNPAADRYPTATPESH
jgi:alpha-L-fucosidase 2